MTGEAQIGVSGLAVMGSGLARNLAGHGYTVALHNRTPARAAELARAYAHEGGFVPAASDREFVASLERPRKVLMMVPAGQATDDVILRFADLLEPGDILIDGGNAHFADTRRREAELARRGIRFVGTGISGGEEGALHGPSIMPGGDPEAYREVGPILETIAAQAGGEPCCAHMGADGAGHFVKMVHNGIEYADMQLIAEAYDLLRRVGGFEPGEIAGILRGWNAGRLESYLIETTAEILAHRDAATGLPFVDVVQDRAEQKGTGRWTVQTALDLGSPATAIAEAVFNRGLSGAAGLRAAGARLVGPVPRKIDRDGLAASVEQALYAAKLVSYAQGWGLIQSGARSYGWRIDLGSVARIWRGGCVIRAGFLDRVSAAFAADPALPTLLADTGFAEQLAAAQDDWRAVVTTAVAQGVAVPGFSSALAYYDAVRSERLPTALVQAQRDFFGAHTYRRVDREGVFHTRWAEPDRTEISAD